MVHILYLDKELTDEQLLHIGLILGCQSIIKDTEMNTYSFIEAPSE